MRYLRIALTFAMLFVFAGQLGASTVQAEGVVYDVQRGDNLYRIAMRYGTTVQAIAAANGIANPNRIYVGQKLVIPGAKTGAAYAAAAPAGPFASATAASSAPGAGGTYVVQSGDTLFRIALRFGVSVQQLAAANGIANPDLIYAGQVLRIPGAGDGSYAQATAYGEDATAYASTSQATAYAATTGAEAAPAAFTPPEAAMPSQPTAPAELTIYFPPPGKCFSDGEVTGVLFEWSPILGAYWYRLHIHRTSDGALREYLITGTTFEVPLGDLFGYGTYHYYVIASDQAQNEITRSAQGQFEICPCCFC